MIPPSDRAGESNQTPYPTDADKSGAVPDFPGTALYSFLIFFPFAGDVTVRSVPPRHTLRERVGDGSAQSKRGFRIQYPLVGGAAEHQ